MVSLSLDCFCFNLLVCLNETLTFPSLSNPVLRYWRLPVLCPYATLAGDMALVSWYVMLYSTPLIDRSTKPAHFTQTETEIASSSNKYGFKTVQVPTSLANRFAKVAYDNTIRNIETCGLLFGKLVSVCLQLPFTSWYACVSRGDCQYICYRPKATLSSHMWFCRNRKAPLTLAQC